jgi:hypothetical protein
MVVDDFDIAGSSVIPDKADAPLVVDPDRMLAVAIRPQSLQPVAGRHAKIAQDTRLIE